MNRGEIYQVKCINEWYYPSDTEGFIDDTCQDSISSLMPTLYSLYMTKARTVEIDSDGDIPMANKYWIKKDLKKVIENNTIETPVRVEARSGTRINVQFIKESEGRIICFLSVTYDDDGITYMNMYVIYPEKKSEECINILFPGFFHGPSKTDVKKAIHLYIREGGFDIGMKYMGYALGILSRNIGTSRYPVHTTSEMKMFQCVVNHYGTSKAQRRSIMRIDKNHKSLSVDELNDLPIIMSREEDPGFDDKDIPVVQLNDKEWEFIAKYICKNNLLSNVETNLHTYLDNPRYGKRYKIGIKLDMCVMNVLVTYAISDDDKLAILVIHQINNNISVVAKTIINSTTHFVSEDLLDHADFYLSIKNIENAPKKLDDIPSPLLGTRNMLQKEWVSFMTAILSFFIVMHDRPQRTRMLRCTKPVEHQKHHKKGFNSNTHTVRILKTVSDAKRLVAESNTNSTERKQRAEAIYTIEEWDREGHWRTLKSGKRVYINPTTCKRHKELATNVDIKIKL